MLTLTYYWSYSFHAILGTFQRSAIHPDSDPQSHSIQPQPTKTQVTNVDLDDDAVSDDEVLTNAAEKNGDVAMEPTVPAENGTQPASDLRAAWREIKLMGLAR